MTRPSDRLRRPVRMTLRDGAPAVQHIRRRAIRDEDPTDDPLTGPPEAYWPMESYEVVINEEGTELGIFETASPAGERRLVKTYPANRFGFAQVGDGLIVIRKLANSIADGAGVARLHAMRHAAEDRLKAMNAANRARWAKDRRGRS